MPPPDLASLADMLFAARTILEYLDKVTSEAFYADAIRRDAVVRQMEIIGEAARRVSEVTRQRVPQLP